MERVYVLHIHDNIVTITGNDEAGKKLPLGLFNSKKKHIGKAYRELKNSGKEFLPQVEDK